MQIEMYEHFLRSHYRSLIQIMDGQPLNGNMLANMGVIDDNWHICVARIEGWKR